MNILKKLINIMLYSWLVWALMLAFIIVAVVMTVLVEQYPMLALMISGVIMGIVIERINNG